MSKAIIVINDVPDLKDEKLVRAILKVFAPVSYDIAEIEFDSSNVYVVSADRLRKEIKKRLEKDIEQEKKGYDLIFLCESGGIILCGEFTDKLLEFGSKIKNLPYSEHKLFKSDFPIELAEGNWVKSVKKETELLNEKPNIAIIEGDAGAHTSTVRKVHKVLKTINKIKPGARIHLIIGTASTRALREWDRFIEKWSMFDKWNITFKISCCWKTNGHVMRLSEVIQKVKKHLDHRHYLYGEYLKENDDTRLEKPFVEWGLYTPPAKKDTPPEKEKPKSKLGTLRKLLHL